MEPASEGALDHPHSLGLQVNARIVVEIIEDRRVARQGRTRGSRFPRNIQLLASQQGSFDPESGIHQRARHVRQRQLRAKSALRTREMCVATTWPGERPYKNLR
jgi:hypothetical protein